VVKVVKAVAVIKVVVVTVAVIKVIIVIKRIEVEGVLRAEDIEDIILRGGLIFINWNRLN
jgi:hypothetical protein